ncbi:hypothetical protein [Streptomyces sp. NPDC005262]|uniref:hypothetical protein n=1 Tax=Streptomyces sp. NPDC005262 TaxID=3364710 RepID=UPI0036C974B5
MGATLDTYVDNLTVNGTVYDFGVDGVAAGRITLRNTTRAATAGRAAPAVPRAWTTARRPAP